MSLRLHMLWVYAFALLSHSCTGIIQCSYLYAPTLHHNVHVLQTTCTCKAGHPGVPSYYMFVCLGYGWVGYLFFLISLS